MKLTRKPRIIYNDDTTSLRFVPPPHTEAKVTIPIRYLQKTQVDVFCWCMTSQIAYSWPSKVIENIYDIRKNNPIEWPTEKKATDLTTTLYDRGVDYLPILIRASQRQRLGFYASFRMNDTHHKSEPEGPLTPKFWKDNQHLRLWEIADARSYYNANLDYSYPQVRRRIADAIGEVAEMYDIDGVELDFCRSPYFFQPSEAWKKRGILTDFVAEIKDDLERWGRKRRRPIGLIVRTPIDEQDLATAGIDAAKWIDKKFMDILVMSYLTNNYNQTLEPWRSLCRGKGVLFYPSVEVTPPIYQKSFYEMIANPLAPAHNYVYKTTPKMNADMQRAMAANFLAQDPDGIYMFNYPCQLFFDGTVLGNDKLTAKKDMVSVLSQMGSLKTLAGHDRHYAFYEYLPIYVEANRPRQFHQNISFTIYDDDLDRAAVTLRFRQIAERNPHAYVRTQNPIVPPGFMNYYLNDRQIGPESIRRTRQPAGKVPSGFVLKKHEQIEITVPRRQIIRGQNTLAFEIPRFPKANDPYVYIYELEVDVRF